MVVKKGKEEIIIRVIRLHAREKYPKKRANTQN